MKPERDGPVRCSELLGGSIHILSPTNNLPNPVAVFGTKNLRGGKWSVSHSDRRGNAFKEPNLSHLMVAVRNASDQPQDCLQVCVSIITGDSMVIVVLEFCGDSPRLWLQRNAKEASRPRLGGWCGRQSGPAFRRTCATANDDQSGQRKHDVCDDMHETRRAA
jgi:hypothetical protein